MSSILKIIELSRRVVTAPAYGQSNRWSGVDQVNVLKVAADIWALLHAQRLACAADLRRDRPDCRPLRFMLTLVLKHHAHGSIPDLRGVLVRKTHRSQVMDSPVNPVQFKGFEVMRALRKGQARAFAPWRCRYVVPVRLMPTMKTGRSIVSCSISG